ncbi:ESX-1 secretion-associated protein EspI [Mycobacterium tuberculosis]|nr:ESX-1 secretion-associated protein EspI [Mycobacterium tuberculosis]
MPIAAGEPPSPEPAASKPPTPPCPSPDPNRPTQTTHTPHAHRRTRTGPTQTTHTSDAHRRTCTHPNRIPVGAPQTTDTTNANRSAAATGITGAPRTLARATSTPAHRTSTALGKDANRRTPARSVQTVCVPGRTTDPACPPTLPTCAPGSPLSHRHRTKRREGSNWSIHPGAAAGRGSIRRAARPRNGALASAVGPTEIVSGSAHPPRADRTSPQPLAAAQLRSACRATRPPRFSRPTCRGAT